MGFKTKRRKTVKVGRQYTYWPGAIDIADPCIIEGSVIKPGEVVTVEHIPDPLQKLAWIRDSKGNVNACFQAALHPL